MAAIMMADPAAGAPVTLPPAGTAAAAEAGGAHAAAPGGPGPGDHADATGAVVAGMPNTCRRATSNGSSLRLLPPAAACPPNTGTALGTGGEWAAAAANGGANIASPKPPNPVAAAPPNCSPGTTGLRSRLLPPVPPQAAAEGSDSAVSP